MAASTRRWRRSIASGHTYEEDGALWLRTTDYGDDKDRVMRKSDGGYTYFVPDVAYHVTKWERGFRKVINVQGSDHHSTVTRVRAGLQALGMGVPPGYPDYVLHKMVHGDARRRGGEDQQARRQLRHGARPDRRGGTRCRRASSSCRARPTPSSLFDIDLARSQSEENPVYYVQYAHARVCAVLRQAGIAMGDAIAELSNADLSPLTSPYEEALLRRLADFPDELAVAARELAPHQVTFYLKDLAARIPRLL